MQPFGGRRRGRESLCAGFAGSRIGAPPIEGQRKTKNAGIEIVPLARDQGCRGASRNTSRDHMLTIESMSPDARDRACPVQAGAVRSCISTDNDIRSTGPIAFGAGTNRRAS